VAGWKTNRIHRWKGRNVQRLMLSSNPRIGEIKLEDIIDRSIMRKLDDSGSIDRMFSFYPAK
jgi:hypothetical protein